MSELESATALSALIFSFAGLPLLMLPIVRYRFEQIITLAKHDVR